MYIQKLSWSAAANRCRNGREFLDLAPTPHDEECTPAGQNIPDNIKECIALIHQLVRIHGEPPEGAEFILTRNDHEFETYYDAAIFYMEAIEPENEDEEEQESPSMEYALKCESGIPDKWDAEAIEELKAAEHTKYLPKEPAKLVKHQGKVLPIKSQTA